jgi:hypothetical protein
MERNLSNSGTRGTTAQVDNIDYLNNKTGEKSMSLAVECASRFNGEGGDQHQAIIKAKSRDIDAYKEMYEVMADFKKVKNKAEENISYIYTLIRASDEMANLIVDASGEGDESEYGEEYKMEPQITSAFEGNPAYAKHTWEDKKYGVQKSAFAPILNSKDEVIAILGIDMAAPSLPIIK